MIAERIKSGWIGIDAGSTSLKIVQLEAGHGLLRVRSRICIPRANKNQGVCRLKDAASPQYQSDSVRGEISAAMQLSSALKGRHAAVAPSMAECELHRIAVKEVRKSEFDAYMRDTVAHLTATSVTGKQLAYWSANGIADSDEDWNVISLSTSVSDQLHEDLSKNRLRCHAITGVPQAIASTVALTVRQSPQESIAVLDWGMRAATFAVVHRGIPTYVRVLKNCGFDQMISQLSKYLGVNSWEAQRVLRETGIGKESSTSSPEELALREAVADPMRNVLSELQRTLEYLKFQKQIVSPQSLLLFGGGSLTPGVIEFLQDRLQLPTTVWSFTASQAEENSETLELDAQYGVAFGLSALFWET